jgi:hypothetical protein
MFYSYCQYQKLSNFLVTEIVLLKQDCRFETFIFEPGAHLKKGRVSSHLFIFLLGPIGGTKENNYIGPIIDFEKRINKIKSHFVWTVPSKHSSSHDDFFIIPSFCAAELHIPHLD